MARRDFILAPTPFVLDGDAAQTVFGRMLGAYVPTSEPEWLVWDDARGVFILAAPRDERP